jgi:hypothetical protein
MDVRSTCEKWTAAGKSILKPCFPSVFPFAFRIWCVFTTVAVSLPIALVNGVAGVMTTQGNYLSSKCIRWNQVGRRICSMFRTYACVQRKNVFNPSCMSAVMVRMCPNTCCECHWPCSHCGVCTRALVCTRLRAQMCSAHSACTARYVALAHLLVDQLVNMLKVGSICARMCAPK